MNPVSADAKGKTRNEGVIISLGWLNSTKTIISGIYWQKSKYMYAYHKLPHPENTTSPWSQTVELKVSRSL